MFLMGGVPLSLKLNMLLSFLLLELENSPPVLGFVESPLLPKSPEPVLHHMLPELLANRLPVAIREFALDANRPFPFDSEGPKRFENKLEGLSFYLTSALAVAASLSTVTMLYY